METPVTAIHPLLARSTLVINQKAKLVEVSVEFGLLDEYGMRVGEIRQVGQSPLVGLLRVANSLDPLLPIAFEIRDASGIPALVLSKPWFSWRVSVSHPDGSTLGHVQKQLRVGKPRFAIQDVAGAEIGSVQAENWRAWDFAVCDVHGQEVARVTKKWEGLAKSVFTNADNYVVQIDDWLSDPLRSLAVAAVVAIDTIVKQGK
ncbi:MAG TPA: phospholipid scramblase-related protein [Egibacteraceae bacterium]|nr:phospholipid scramblase-related protein [Egibacteraceae bacterium]